MQEVRAVSAPDSKPCFKKISFCYFPSFAAVKNFSIHNYCRHRIDTVFLSLIHSLFTKVIYHDFSLRTDSRSHNFYCIFTERTPRNKDLNFSFSRHSHHLLVWVYLKNPVPGAPGKKVRYVRLLNCSNPVPAQNRALLS